MNATPGVAVLSLIGCHLPRELDYYTEGQRASAADTPAIDVGFEHEIRLRPSTGGARDEAMKLIGPPGKIGLSATGERSTLEFRCRVARALRPWIGALAAAMVRP